MKSIKQKAKDQQVANYQNLGNRVKRIKIYVRRARQHRPCLQTLFGLFDECKKLEPKVDFMRYTPNEMADIMEIYYKHGL
jgi:hypothetical protein